MRKGQVTPPEVREKLRQSHLGKKMSPEAIENMRQAQIGRKHSEEVKEKIRKSNLGKTMSAESRVKMGLSHLGRKRSIQSKRRQSDVTRGHKKTPEHIAKMVEGNKRFYENNPDKYEAMRKRLGEWQSTLTPEQRKIRSAKGRLANLKLGLNRKPTSIEIKMAEEFDAIGIKYSTQVVVGKYCADFGIKNTNVLVECDGDYWHSPKVSKGRDEIRDAWLNTQGYVVLRIKEMDIRRNSNKCAAEVLSYLTERK